MIRIALILMFSLLVTACGRDGDDSSSDSLSLEQTGKQVGFEMINTSSDPVDFVIKESASGTLLHEVMKNDIDNDDELISQYVHSWSSATPLIVDISVEDTNSQQIIDTVEELVTNSGEHFWLIAWPDSELGETRLFTGRQEAT